jgi:hypothetical protein
MTINASKAYSGFIWNIIIRQISAPRSDTYQRERNDGR